MISKNGLISVYGWLLGLSVLFVLLLLPNSRLSAYGKDVNTFQLFFIYATIANVLVRIVNRGIVYKVCIITGHRLSGGNNNIGTYFFFCKRMLQICAQALFLGLAMAAGCLISVQAPASWKPFGW